MAEAPATGAWQGLVVRERGRQARLRPIAEELAAIHREAQQDGTQAAELIRARDLMDGLTVHPSRAERMNTRPSVQDVLDAATAATSLLDPEPLTAHGPPRIVPDLGQDDGNHAGKARAEATMSRLGYQHGGSFGVQRDDRTGSARSVRDATL
ncbi:MAG: hypothetical protein VX747_13320 [Actinomycetota bacterium]|nr:hypothetical protein [Actinomycetota bacterium]